MAYRQFLIVLFLFLTSVAHGGYAQLAPPPGWTTSPGATGWYRAAANDVSFSGGIRGTATVINVGGSDVRMPAAYRFSANAGRFAARALYATPALLTVAAISWLAEECISYSSGQFHRTCGPGVAPQSDGYEYAPGNVSVWSPTYQQACASGWAASPYLESSTHKYVPTTMYPWTCDADYVQKSNNQVLSVVSNPLNRRTATCPAGSYVTPAGCSVTAPPNFVTQEQVETIMQPKPLPPGLPQTLPVPLPVDLPIINPSPDPAPLPQPMRIPVGDPQPIPNTSPTRWTQPATDIVPSPTLDSPWRVDVQPRNIETLSPTPLPPSSPVPVNPPVGTTSSPVPSPDLCASNPEILACQKVKFEVPDSDEIVKRDKEVTFTANGGWGGGGSCPAPRHLSSVNAAFKFDQVCDFMAGIRPVAVAIAWLIGGLILLGSRGGSS